MLDRQQVRQALTGPIASLSTPFLADDQIDYKSIAGIIDFAIDAGSKAIVLDYGQSLFGVLSDTEVAELTKFTAEHIAGRALVIAADRKWWLGKEVEFAVYARQAGADMLMVLPPNWAGSATDECLIDHYKAVSDEIPVVATTSFFEQRSVPMTIELLRKLHDEMDGIYAVKDDICDEMARRLGPIVYDKWAVFDHSNKRMIINSIPYGCDGYISNFLLFKPEVAHNFWQKAVANDTDELRKIAADCDIPFWDFLEKSPKGPDAAIHGILELKGLAKRYRRKPYSSLDDAEMEQLADFLKTKGWLN